VLAGTSFLLTLVNPAVSILAGTGRMRLLIATGLAGLFSNVFISTALVKVFGFKGVLAGTAFAYGGVSLVMLYVLQRMPEFRVAPSRLLRTSAVSVAAAVLPGLLVGMVWRPHNLVGLLLVGTLLVLLYSLAALAMAENRRLLFSASVHLRNSLGSLFLARGAGQTSHA